MHPYRPEWAEPLAPPHSFPERDALFPPGPGLRVSPLLPRVDLRPVFVRAIALALGWLALCVLGVVALVVGLVACATVAWGNANTIPERQATAREVLGYGPDEPLVLETTWGFGQLEFVVDEHVGLPDVPSLVGPEPAPRASTVRLAVTSYLSAADGLIHNTPAGRAPVVAQTYSWSFPTWALSTYLPPCVSPAQAAVALADWTGEYSCLTEAELVASARHIADMAVWSKPDWPMVRWLQELHGSSGLPIPMGVMWRKALTEDNSAGPLPSVLRMDVYYVFVAPKDPGWVAPVDPAVP